MGTYLCQVVMHANIIQYRRQEIAGPELGINGYVYDRVTHVISPFPLHWVTRPRKEAIKTLRRFPDVSRRERQDCLEVSFSRDRVCSICANSAFTNSEVESPSAWYLKSDRHVRSYYTWEYRVLLDQNSEGLAFATFGTKPSW